MSVEGFDANCLTKEERLAVLNGSKSLVDLGAIERPHKVLPALLADLSPPDNPRNKNGEEKTIQQEVGRISLLIDSEGSSASMTSQD